MKMKRTRSKILSVFLTVCMVFSCMAGIAVTAEAAVDPPFAITASGLGDVDFDISDGNYVFTASPNSNWSFYKWSYDTSGSYDNWVDDTTSGSTLTVPCETADGWGGLQAYFVPSAAVSPNGGGSVSVTGNYGGSTSYSFSAAPNSDYTFSKWTYTLNGSETGSTDNPLTISGIDMYNNVSGAVTAVFVADSSAPVVSVTPAGAGTVSVAPAADECWTLTASPESGFAFSYWTWTGIDIVPYDDNPLDWGNNILPEGFTAVFEETSSNPKQLGSVAVDVAG